MMGGKALRTRQASGRDMQCVRRMQVEREERDDEDGAFVQDTVWREKDLDLMQNSVGNERCIGLYERSRDLNLLAALICRPRGGAVMDTVFREESLKP